MKKIILLFLALLLFTGCSPSPKAIEKALAKTQAAMPTATFTPTPTNTSIPTSTPTSTPTITPTPTESFEDIQNNVFGLIKKFVRMEEYVDEILYVKGDSGTMQIKLITRYTEAEPQPEVAFHIINILSNAIVDAGGNEYRWSLVSNGTGKFNVELIVMSAYLEHKYHSITDYETLMKIYNTDITFDEWVIASHAGFD